MSSYSLALLLREYTPLLMQKLQILQQFCKILSIISPRIMASIYEERLQILASGYIRQCIGNSEAPDATCTECARWLREKLQFTAKKYYSSYNTLPLQIYLEPNQFAVKILNHRHIKRYRINYKPSHATHDGHDTEADHTFTSIMYPFHCLSYTQFGDISFDRSGTVFIQIVALDHEDRIIEKSEYQSKYVNVNSVSHYFDNYDRDAIRKYWKTNIVSDDQDDEVVNVDQWIDALKRNDILKDGQTPEVS